MEGLGEGDSCEEGEGRACHGDKRERRWPPMEQMPQSRCPPAPVIMNKLFKDYCSYALIMNRNFGIFEYVTQSIISD